MAAAAYGQPCRSYVSSRQLHVAGTYRASQDV